MHYKQLLPLLFISTLIFCCCSPRLDGSTQLATIEETDTCVVIVDSLSSVYRDYLLRLDTAITGISLDSALNLTNEIRSGLSHFSGELIQNASDRKRAALESWIAERRAQSLTKTLFFKLLEDMPEPERDKGIWIAGGLALNNEYRSPDDARALFETFSPKARENAIGRRYTTDIVPRGWKWSISICMTMIRLARAHPGSLRV